MFLMGRRKRISAEPKLGSPRCSSDNVLRSKPECGKESCLTAKGCEIYQLSINVQTYNFMGLSSMSFQLAHIVIIHFKNFFFHFSLYHSQECSGILSGIWQWNSRGSDVLGLRGWASCGHSSKSSKARWNWAGREEVGSKEEGAFLFISRRREDGASSVCING